MSAAFVRRGLCLFALLLTVVLAPSSAQGLLVGDGYWPSVVVRFFETTDYPSTWNGWYFGCTFSQPLGTCIEYEVLSTSDGARLTLALYDEQHIVNLTPVREYSIPLNPIGHGLGLGSLSSYTVPPDGDGAVTITVTGGVIDLKRVWYVENYDDGRHRVAYWEEPYAMWLPYTLPSNIPGPVPAPHAPHE